MVIIFGIGSFVIIRKVFLPGRVRNVVLISIDTCRADFLSCYGYQLQTTPNIDKLAQNGILFENAYTTVPFTLPAHCSMLTGTVPGYHGVLDNQGYRLGEDNITLAETLSDNGYTTAAFISSFILDSQFGLAQGFDSYEDEFENEQNPIGVVERTGDETTRHVIEWLEEKRGKKNFIFLHYYDPHLNYEPPEPFDSKFVNYAVAGKSKQEQDRRNAYAGEIAFTDYCIGQVIDKLKELGMYEKSLIIVTSDHGEGLGEHRENTHGYFIYQSTIKVPLVFILPGGPKAKRINSPVSIIDIPSTVFSLLGIESPNMSQGKDLTPYFKGGRQPYPDRHIYCQSLGPTVYIGNSLLGVVNDRYKYIQTTRPELYELTNDPEELTNLVDKESNRARIMKDKLTQILEETVRKDAALGAKSTIDEESRKRLETLGYIGGEVSEDLSFDQNKEDPKDLIDYHVLSMQLGPLVVQEKFTEARQLCQKLILKRPGFFKPYFNLAKVAKREGKFEEVIANLNTALELNPGYIKAFEGLADTYKELGELDKSIGQYRKILEYQPDDIEAYFHMANLLYDEGRFAEANQYLTKELESNPTYVEMILTLADKLLEKQQIRQAHEYYLRAIKLKPDSDDVLNTLGWLEAASTIKGIRNPKEAIRHAQRACELTEYKTPEYLDTLALAYAASGDFKKAVETADKAIEAARMKGDAALVGRIQKRKGLYSNGKAYVDAQLAP
jgi:arylsulfatase A-like enzyme/tetratricopeptide (TPR) repeat protein